MSTSPRRDEKALLGRPHTPPEQSVPPSKWFGRCSQSLLDRIPGARRLVKGRNKARNSPREVDETEGPFELIANIAPVLIWMSGIDKRCIYFNKPWLDFTGRSLEEELGGGWSQGVHPDDLSGCLGTYMQAFDRREEFKMEYRLRRHDGGYRWVLDIGVPRFALDRAFIGYIGVAVDVTDRKIAEEALAGVSRRLIEAQEQERARIARELHDDANQRLAALVMNIEQLRDDLPEQAVELRGRMDQLREHTLELSNDIRTLAHELHPPGMEFLGLAGAARGFCHEFGLQQKIAIDLTIRDVPSNLPFDISLCLFRVMQEALHNSAKHSAARNVIVELWGDPDGVRLIVSDAGTGFELQKTVGKSRGLGLTSMQERVKLQNGTFAIESQPNRGTRIHVSVPFSANAVPMRATG